MDNTTAEEYYKRILRQLRDYLIQHDISTDEIGEAVGLTNGSVIRKTLPPIKVKKSKAKTKPVELTVLRFLQICKHLKIDPIIFYLDTDEDRRFWATYLTLSKEEKTALHGFFWRFKIPPQQDTG